MTTAAHRWLAPAAAVLAVDLAVVVLLGPLVTGVIDYRVTSLLRNQLIGSDIVTLGVIAPLALAAAVLLRRRSPTGPLLALPTALAAWYFAAELVLGPDRTGLPGNDEAFLPLFLGVLLLSGAIALGAWQSVAAASTQLRRSPGRWVGGLLLAVVTLFVVGRYLPAWLQIVRGTASSDYTAGPGMWWTIAFQDLALLLPAAAATGVGLLRQAPWADKAAFAVSGCLALIGAAVTAMAWSMTVHDDAGATTGTAMTMTAIGLGTAAPAVVCWTAHLRAQRQAAVGAAGDVQVERRAARHGQPA